MESAAGILAFDTSAYTTSLAFMSPQGGLYHDERRLLAVAPGQRGLRQSEAVFQHIRRLPELVAGALGGHAGRLLGVCCSTRPRPAAASYMPVFQVGAGCGKVAAAAAAVPFWPLSHQEGHLWAAVWSLPAAAGSSGLAQSALFLHASGGTTEIVRVDGLGAALPPAITLRPWAASADISAGQFVDRAGVALGLPFPAGPHLEELAAAGAPGALVLPVAVRGSALSFSGPESAARRAIAASARPADVARAIYSALAAALAAWLATAAAACVVSEALLAGGVLASPLLQELLAREKPLQGVRLWYADSAYCRDNAVGLAAAGAAIHAGVPVLHLPQRGGRSRF